MGAKTPDKIKKLKGTEQPCRVNKNAPVVDSGKPARPTQLDYYGKKVYEQLSDWLVEIGVLTKHDEKALELLCRAYSEWREAIRIIKSEGSIYETKSRDGSIMKRKHPAVEIASDAFRRVKGMLTEFGLTPASRSGVGVIGGKEKDDPLAAYLKKFGDAN